MDDRLILSNCKSAILQKIDNTANIEFPKGTNIGNYSYIEVDGGYLAFCRNFQYVLSQTEKNNAIYKGSCENQFFILKLDENFNFIKQIKPEFNIPYRYFSHFPKLSMLRDFRSVKWNDDVYFSATFPTEIWNWKTVVFKLVSQDYSKWEAIYFSDECYGQKNEKNWMPIPNVLGEYITSINSKQIISRNIFSNKTRHIPQNIDYAEVQFGGSTNFIEFKDGYLGIVHLKHQSHKYGYNHYFVRLDKDYRIQSISKPFKFMSDKIEFSQFLIRKDGKLMFSFSEIDTDNYIVSVNEDEISEFIEEHDAFRYRKDIVNAVWFDNWDNLGDMLTPYIIEYMTGKKSLNSLDSSSENRRLVSLGSLLYNFQINDSDIIWGTGIYPGNNYSYKGKNLDIRMVRGPITREALISDGQKCPETYGDPAMLTPLVFNMENVQKKYDYGIVIHRNDKLRNSGNINYRLNKFLDSCQNYKIVEIDIQCKNGIEQTIQQINECRKIVSSALHPIIMSEAYGIPAAYVQLEKSDFKSMKLADYYLGSNRKNYKLNDWTKKIFLEKLEFNELPKYDIEKIINSFPIEFK